MSEARKLFELQELDLEVQQKKEALSRVESQLGESAALKEARASLAEERQRLSQLEKAQKEAEHEVDDLRAKVIPLDRKLYGGTVSNPKELTSMQQELEQFLASLRSKEDRVLDIMSGAEAAQRAVAGLRLKLKEVEAEWQREQKRLTQEQTELKAALSRLAEQRQGLASQIEPAALELYEGLSHNLQGRGMARVEQGRCQGCRLALSVAELQRARGSGLVQCSSCRRILYLG